MMKVLIVDDSALIRRQIREALEGAFDCEVSEAADGREAVETAGGFRPDIILMDVEMGGMGGVEATREIVHAGKGGKVIMVTGAKAPSKVVESIKAGAVNYLHKPIEIDHLVKVISNTLRTVSPSVMNEPDSTFTSARSRMNIPSFAPSFKQA